MKWSVLGSLKCLFMVANRMIVQSSSIIGPQTETHAKASRRDSIQDYLMFLRLASCLLSRPPDRQPHWPETIPHPWRCFVAVN